MLGYNIPQANTYIPFQGQQPGFYAPFPSMNNLGQNTLPEYTVLQNQPVNAFYPPSNPDFIGGFGAPGLQFHNLQFQPTFIPSPPFQINGVLQNSAEQAKVKVLRDSRRDAVRLRSL